MFRKKAPSGKKLLRGQSLDSHTFQVLLKTGVKPASPKRDNLILTSCSEESESDTDLGHAEASLRRGRRDAVCDNKTVGDDSPERSSDYSDPATNGNLDTQREKSGKKHNIRRRSHDRQSSGLQTRQLVNAASKQLRRQNTIAEMVPSSPTKSEESKTNRHAFSLFKLNMMKVKEKDESIVRLKDLLQNVKLSEFKDALIMRYRDINWMDLTIHPDNDVNEAPVDDTELKRRGALWELLQSECSFLVERLMVLKHCFLETLKQIQVEGCLMYIEPASLFGNIEEICYVSYNFCKEFISDLLQDMNTRPSEFGRTEILLRNINKFSHSSNEADVYHTYCLNYQGTLNYVEKLRKHNDFLFFEKWCESDERCCRLQLTDLLVAPVQRCTKLPLLLQAIRHYTLDPTENQQILDTIHDLNESLKQLEDKIDWLKHYERFIEIQENLVWPSIRELDHKAFVPDFLKSALAMSSTRIFTTPSRRLIHEGFVILVDSAKLHDMCMFLFDDALLVTKIKKSFKKTQIKEGSNSKSYVTERISYHVYNQPIPIDELSVYDVVSVETNVSSMTNALVLVHTNRFEQIIAVYTIQTKNLPCKESWLRKIQETKESFLDTSTQKTPNLKRNSLTVASHLKSPRKCNNKL